MHFDNNVLVGMFLGYSLLQVLGYWVATLSTPLESLQNHLSKKFLDLKHGRQIASQAHVEVKNETDQCQVIELERESLAQKCTDCEEHLKVMEQQIKEVKARIEIYEKHGQISKMTSKIPIRISK